MALSGTYILRETITGNTIYYIHDNGGRPYKIDVSRDGIKVYMDTIEPYYRCVKSADCDYIYDKLVITITNFDGYWSGYDDSSYGFHGNSLLVKINDHKYLHIGWNDIFYFQTLDVIQDYASHVGNNDVPYPVAYGSEYLYLIWKKRYMDRKLYTTELIADNAGIITDEYLKPFFRNEIMMPSKKLEKIKVMVERRM